jgi:hypothetical protein
MSYKAMQQIRLTINNALAKGAITAAEAMTLTHHYSMGSRSAKRYTSTEDKRTLANIAMKVRVSGGK